MFGIEDYLWVLLVGGAFYLLYKWWSATKSRPNAELRGMRLQACERMLLLVQRSEFSSLVLRIFQPGMNVSDLQSQLSRQLREEWEYNTVQQLYVSDQVWQAVEQFVQQQSLQVHAKASECDPNADGQVLATLLLTDAKNEHEMAQKAKMLIKKEVSIWM